MKKWILIGIVAVIIVFFISSKMYYPPLPISSISKAKVISKLKESNENVVKITEEDDYQWYITEMNQGKGYKYLKNMLVEKGWTYKTQEGSVFLFEKENKKLGVITRMWTKNYVIFKIEKGWDSY
ncbi:hypothetical protein ACFVRR_22535 [Gottfriedia sp. NPDC057948]|uniref:hypothetical protein n=1 Tax=Gottfriedia sp. NPDC057948 TaxID=3346287 RepID=UPI0036D88C46